MSNHYQAATVPIEPFGKARPRVTDNGTFMPSSYTRARAALRLMFGPVIVPPPWGVQITAVRKMPASWSKRQRAAMDGQYCRTKPDADNIAGAVMDALFDDDAAVVSIACLKRWGAAGELRIEVQTLQEAPAP